VKTSGENFWAKISRARDARHLRKLASLINRPEGLAQLGDIPRLDQQRAVAVGHVFDDAVHIRGDDRHPDLHRLDQ
jgi:hypothetical protein